MRLLLVIGALSLFTFIDCGAQLCVPGKTESCACLGVGQKGVQTCKANGSGWDTCLCPKEQRDGGIHEQSELIGDRAGTEKPLEKQQGDKANSDTLVPEPKPDQRPKDLGQDRDLTGEKTKEQAPEPAPCTDECKEGDAKCDGGGVSKCEQDTGRCWKWGTSTSCPKGEACDPKLLKCAAAPCQSDNDCPRPNTRCCTGTSPANKDGKVTGKCFKVQATEGSLCDPCTQPCDKGTDGKLMGCLPGSCNRPPHRCRRACNLGNANQAADECNKAGATPGSPAEYCTRSDVTKFNPTLGSCAHGDNCDPINQNTCQAGAQPPYNNCCPQGFGCYPADRDANICIPEGSTGPKQQNCELHNCQGGKNCTKGYLCTVSVDAQGRPQGPSSCNPMCQCGSLCRAGLPSSSGCPTNSFCVPMRLVHGNVPLPIGVCHKP